ncbi:MAG: uroporphyrinogen decarboxylase, partial [Gemmatimonadetes bacterium]|nr:uroporphyrinogen decarboxylase [Gemmatimonadota bacterium]
MPPIWIMRQAGRILKPYRDLRQRHGSLLKLFKTPELAAEITLMPVDLLGVDAAILFTDLVTPLEALGCELTYAPGPVFARPIRSAADINGLRNPVPADDLAYVLEAARLVR